MPDIAHVYGQDLQLGPSGDLAVVDRDAMTQQRILHRLLTAPGDYIWQLDYGAGLPAFVGEPGSAPAIEAVIQAQLALESSVATLPQPAVTVASSGSTFTATITYADADTGQSQTLGLDSEQFAAPAYAQPSVATLPTLPAVAGRLAFSAAAASGLVALI